MKASTCSILAFFLVVPLLTGCGTLVHGPRETYRVISDPPDAIAVFSSGELCTTPCEVEKKRNEPFFIKVMKEGYHPYDIRVEEQTNKDSKATMVANLLMLGSVIWESIDRINGCNKELTPNPALVKLEPIDPRPERANLLSGLETGLTGTKPPEHSVYR